MEVVEEERAGKEDERASWIGGGGPSKCTARERERDEKK
jgi:hypothetical protein